MNSKKLLSLRDDADYKKCQLSDAERRLSKAKGNNYRLEQEYRDSKTELLHAESHVISAKILYDKAKENLHKLDPSLQDGE